MSIAKVCLVFLEKFLWSLPLFDFYSGSGPDCLPRLDIGLSQWIIKFLFAEIESLNEEGAERVKRTVNERFALMPKFPKMIRFPHGITKVQLDKKGKFQGKEYRSIMKASEFGWHLPLFSSSCLHFPFSLSLFHQQLVVVMLGLVSNDSIKTMVSYAEMYKAAKSAQHAMETLADLEKKVEVYAPTLVFSSSSSSSLSLLF